MVNPYTENNLQFRTKLHNCYATNKTSCSETEVYIVQVTGT